MIEKLKDITISSEYFGQNVKLESILSDRINILYGRNGSGKSTIADAFRKYKEGNDCCLKLDANLTSEERKNIFIFDEQFIRKNLDVSDSDGLGAIVTIGEAVSRKEEEEKLMDDLEEANINKDKWDQNMTTAKANADVINKRVYDKLNSDSGFTGRRKLIEGKKNKKTEQCDYLLGLDTSTLTGSEDSEAIRKEINNGIAVLSKTAGGAKLTWIPNDIAEKNLTDAASWATSLMAQNIEKPELNDREKEIIALGGNYIQKTRNDILDPRRDYCPLCHQPISLDYRETLEDTITRIEAAMSDKAEEYKRRLESILSDCTYSPDMIPEDVIGLFPAESKELKTERKALGIVVTSLQELIKKRMEDVFAPAINYDFKQLDDAVHKVKAASDKLSTVITSYNSTIDSRATLIAELSAKNALLAYLENQVDVEAYKKEKEKVSKAEAELGKWGKKIIDLGKELDALRDAHTDTNGARLFINHCLNQIFMSKDRLELVLEDPEGAENGTYILKSNGFRVKPEKVSVGERNAIALAYFFASTFQGRADKERFSHPALYIIDDPISSFDQDNRAGILTFINAQFGDILYGCDKSKILVLSHDLQTVDNIKVIADRLLSVYDLRINHIIELRNKKAILEQRELNGYQILLKSVLAFAMAFSLDNERRNMGNELRQLLESYAQFNYNSSFDFILSSDDVLKSVPEEYHNYYRRLAVRLVMNSLSHSSVQVDSINSLKEPFTQEELQGIARAVLLFIYYTNPLHLQFLLKNGKKFDNATINCIKSWADQLPSDDAAVKARKAVFDRLRTQYINKQFVVEGDEKGNLHCGECLIKGRPTAPLAVGDTVTIKSIVENTNPATNRIYPAFVAWWE